MTPVVAHLETIGEVLRQGPANAERRRLLVNRARVGTLAASHSSTYTSRWRPAATTAFAEAARESGDNLLGEYFNGLDRYPDVRRCLQALKDAGYFVGIAGDQTA